jgi:hypothetical protein
MTRNKQDDFAELYERFLKHFQEERGGRRLVAQLHGVTSTIPREVVSITDSLFLLDSTWPQDDPRIPAH